MNAAYHVHSPRVGRPRVRGTRTGGHATKAGWRILVVDDSVTVLAFAARALRSAGHEVRTAADMWIATIVAVFALDLIPARRPPGRDLPRTTAATALRKRSIGKTARIVVELLPRGPAVGCLENPVVAAGEALGDRGADRLLVLDQ